MAARERVESPLRPASTAGSVPPTPRAPSGASRLPLREMTGWEEEYLERNQTDDNTARLCNEVLARCLVPPGVDPGPARQTVRGLLVAERDRELVALRKLSLGPDIRGHVDCPDCEAVSEVDFSLDLLPLDFAVPDSQVALEVPDVGPVLLHLPTAGDQEDLADAGLVDDAARRTWLLARCLEAYGDRSAGFDLDFVRGLPMKVRRSLDSAIEEKLPRLDLEMAVECSHCGTGFTAPFDVHLFFFRTSRACRWSAPRRAPARTCLPLVRAGHRRPHAAPEAGLPADARGGRGRLARRRAHRAVLTAPAGRSG